MTAYFISRLNHRQIAVEPIPFVIAKPIIDLCELILEKVYLPIHCSTGRKVELITCLITNLAFGSLLLVSIIGNADTDLSVGFKYLASETLDKNCTKSSSIFFCKALNTNNL